MITDEDVIRLFINGDVDSKNGDLQNSCNKLIYKEIVVAEKSGKDRISIETIDTPRSISGIKRKLVDMIDGYLTISFKIRKSR